MMLDRLGGNGRIWLDYLDYARRLFAGEEPDLWLDAARFLSVYSQGQQLLQSDVLSVPLTPFFTTWIQEYREIGQAWQGKKATFALRNVMALEEPRQILSEVLAGISRLFPATPLVLHLEVPREWIRQLRALEFLQLKDAMEGGEVSDDDQDAAAVILADGLRAFSDQPVTALVLRETEPLAVSAKRCPLCQPIWNLADHYKWLKGIQLPGRPDAEWPLGETVQFALFPEAEPELIASCCMAGKPFGGGLNQAFWTADASPAPFHFPIAFGSIPADAQPERVLARLNLLRGK